MDLTHWFLVGLIFLTDGILLLAFWKLLGAVGKDEAIDAATFLALRELRERFERSK